ncbi:MAG: NAD-dependent epimerase/dehydratase family protein [Paracoccaceae bacterium]
MKKLVLTGAAGKLGTQLRGPLAAMAEELVSTDIAEAPGPLAPNERWVPADLADKTAMHDLIDGADMVVHFGAIGDEGTFEQVLGPNIVGAYNVWEAARLTGVQRIVYASSIHAVGMYPKTEAIGVDVPHRADGFYGIAKCFAEDVARMYWEKSGVESVCLRILSCTPEPVNTRALGSWLSYGDLVRLVTASITTPITGFTVAYGVSNNDRCPVDNSAAAFLGYKPQDNAEAWAAQRFAEAGPADPSDLGQLAHGGPFASAPINSEGLSAKLLTKPVGG